MGRWGREGRPPCPERSVLCPSPAQVWSSGSWKKGKEDSRYGGGFLPSVQQAEKVGLYICLKNREKRKCLPACLPSHAESMPVLLICPVPSHSSLSVLPPPSFLLLLQERDRRREEKKRQSGFGGGAMCMHAACMIGGEGERQRCLLCPVPCLQRDMLGE